MVPRIRKHVGVPVGGYQLPADWNQALAGKKVLVTGASRGLGAAIAVMTVEIGRLEGAIGLASRAGAAVEIHQRHFRERLQVHPLAISQRVLRRHQRHQWLIGQLPVRHRQ